MLPVWLLLFALCAHGAEILSVPQSVDEPSPLAPAGERGSIQRYLASLKLGDTLKQIKLIYPPTRKWSKYREPGGRVKRIIIERGYSKWFPPRVSTIRLGMRRRKLMHIQLIYDRDSSKRKHLSELVVDLSLIYGEPRRWGETYFWFDRSLVIAVSNAKLKTGRGHEFRTSLELMEKGYFEPFR